MILYIYDFICGGNFIVSSKMAGGGFFCVSAAKVLMLPADIYGYLTLMQRRLQPVQLLRLVSL